MPSSTSPVIARSAGDSGQKRKIKTHSVGNGSAHTGNEEDGPTSSVLPHQSSSCLCRDHGTVDIDLQDFPKLVHIVINGKLFVLSGGTAQEAIDWVSALRSNLCKALGDSDDIGNVDLVVVGNATVLRCFELECFPFQGRR